MPTELLWIVKDPASERLSHSSRFEDSRIRHHVQIYRQGGAYHKSQASALPDDNHVPRKVLVQQYETTNLGSYRPLNVSLTWPLSLSNQRLTHAERYGLDFYVHRTARECCGWQDDHFWNTLVMQACHTSPEITHALVSIAAWHKGLSELLDSEEAAQMSAFTSSQWLKTLACAKRSARVAYSTSLVHCVVLACLQAHRSDYQDFRLVRSATAMLQELDTPVRIVPASELEMIDKYVRPLVERLQARICMICDLPAALQRSAQKRQLLGLEPRECPCIPTRFSTLRQARDCLETIFDWAHDHISWDHMEGSPTFLPNLHNLLKSYVGQWNTALATMSGIPVSNATALLRLSSLHGLVLVQTCTASSEIVFDAHLSTFRAMTDILSSFGPTNSHTGTISFGIDSGLLDIVAFMATRCRDPCVRYAAIAWLQTASRIEGDRLSIVSAQIACAWMRLEEAGLTSIPVCAADIPEQKRLRLVRGARHHANGLVILEFAKQAVGCNGEETRLKFCIDERSGQDYVDQGTGIRQLEQDLALPDVVIKRCGAAFLEDAEMGSYHCVEIDRFYFPIPRI